MTIFRRLWSLLSVLGPAPATKSPPTLESGDRGVFDPPADEADDEDSEVGGDGDEGEDVGADRSEADETADGETADDGAADGDGSSDEDEGDEQTTAQGDDDAGDGDGDETAGEGEDDADPETGVPESDDGARSLFSSWETRLAAAARESGDQRPRISLGGLGLSESARKKFDELRAKDEDGKHDAEAIFEVAVDAVLQTLGRYHDEVAGKRFETIDKSVRNIEVGRKLTAFRKEYELTKAVERRMASAYLHLADKYGWRHADSVPLKDLYRMAGGKRAAKPDAKRAAAKPDPEARAREQKRATLGKAAGPRATGRHAPDGAGGKKPSRDAALDDFAADARSRGSFFQLG